MPIINVEPGEVYEFTTVGGSSNVIAQFAGTSEVFTRDVYGLFRITGSNANLIIDGEAKLRIEGQTVFDRTPIGITWYPVNTTTHGTGTSSMGFNGYFFTGSFITTFGTTDHLVLLNSPNLPLADSARPFIRLLRKDDNTAKLTVSSSNILSGPYYFNGTETLSGSISCTDPFCSIEIAAADSIRWVVTNAIGNWTSP